MINASFNRAWRQGPRTLAELVALRDFLAALYQYDDDDDYYYYDYCYLVFIYVLFWVGGGCNKDDI